MRDTVVVLLILLTEVLIGSATGVQRAVLSIEVSRNVGVALALLPIISFGATKSIADYFAAVMSLRKGRRRALLLGVSAHLAGALAITLFPPPYNFLLGNVLVGAGEGFVYATATIMLRDLLGLERSALSFSYIESAGYIGYAAGAFLGGYTLSSLGSTAPLRIILAASALAFAASLAIPEVRGSNEYERPEKWSPEEFPLAQLLRNPSCSSSLLAAHVAKAADSMVWGVIPLLVVARGWDAYYAGLAQSFLLAMWSLMMPFWSYYSDKAGRKFISTLGLLTAAAMLIALPETRGPPDLLLMAMVLGVGYAMYYPILPTPFSDLAPPGRRELAIGLYRAVRDAGYFTGAVLGSLLLQAFPAHLEGALMNTGILLATTATAFSVVFRETRPTWPFLDLVIEHVSIIREVLRLQCEVVRCFFEGRHGEMLEYSRRIKELERKADVVKREIVWRMWSGVFPASSREEFERLVEEIDKVAGAMLESGEKLLWVKQSPGMENLYKLLIEMLRETERLAERLVENLRLLSLSPLYAVRATSEIDAGERRVDELRAEFIRELRTLLSEGGIDLLSALSLMSVADLIELTSDDFQDAADLIRIVAYRHAALPLERHRVKTLGA
uniref:MFS transporter n=2 Tax=Thermofilum pendens TaxID=2269 RepID=A0A7J3X782_THEPE